MPKVILVMDQNTMDDASVYEQHPDGTATWTIILKRGVQAFQFAKNNEMVEAVFEVMVNPAVIEPPPQVAVADQVRLEAFNPLRFNI